MSVPATNQPLYEQLRKLIPGLPEHCHSLTLEMKAGYVPMLTVMSRADMTTFDGTLRTSEWVTQRFDLVPHTTADANCS